MEGGTIVLVVVLGLLVLFALWLAGAYNALVRLRNRVKEAWAQIDVQLKRRHDLIPNLVETVKGYAGHEKETLEGVIQARSQAVGAQGVEERSRAEQNLTGALGRLLVIVEQYPDLKASTNFLALQEELTSTENRIAFSRQYYNESVLRYNTKVQSFPANLAANAFSFGEEPFFELEDRAQREAPQVKF